MPAKNRKSSLFMGGVAVELIRKPVKNINLRVSGHEGHVRVSAPLRVSEREIRQFVMSRLGWIETQRQRLAAMQPPAELSYISGERHEYMGESYPLQITELPATAGIRLNGDACLHMTVRPAATPGERADLLDAWYREQLAVQIPGLIRHYEPIMGVQVAQWRIRKMKTRWGSCNIVKRRIWLNLELAKLPPQCLEYVVVHEMTHLLERGHNARFYALMGEFMPSWRHARELLRERIL